MNDHAHYPDPTFYSLLYRPSHGRFLASSVLHCIFSRILSSIFGAGNNHTVAFYEPNLLQLRLPAKLRRGAFESACCALLFAFASVLRPKSDTLHGEHGARLSELSTRDRRS